MLDGWESLFSIGASIGSLVTLLNVYFVSTRSQALEPCRDCAALRQLLPGGFVTLSQSRTCLGNLVKAASRFIP